MKEIRMIKKYLFKIIIILIGIRFYRLEECSKDSCNDKKINHVEFVTTDGNKLEFSFYRDEYLHYIYKNGRVIEDVRFRFIVKTHMNKDLPEKLHKYNDIVFYIKACYLTWFNEDVIINGLLNIYLDFIQHDLKK